MTEFAPFQGPDRPPEPSVELQVVLLFENMQCSLRAKQAFDHLLAELEMEDVFRFEPISFDLLRELPLHQSPAQNAADADIVVIAADDVALPAHVESWLGTWLAARTHLTAAVVVSLDECVCNDSVTANFLHHLMDLTSVPGVTLFHHFAPTPAPETVPSLNDAWRLPRASIAGWPGTLCRSESPRFRI